MTVNRQTAYIERRLTLQSVARQPAEVLKPLSGLRWIAFGATPGGTWPAQTTRQYFSYRKCLPDALERTETGAFPGSLVSALPADAEHGRLTSWGILGGQS